MNIADLFNQTEFHARHIGPDEVTEPMMLKTLGVATRDALISEVVPAHIRSAKPLALQDLPSALTEAQAMARLRSYADENQVWRSYIGMGYYNTITPQVLLRNVFENPGWYTAYTPYQAEIAQGRLESLMNYQQMVIDLTGLDVANASLLDEATAAAEAMTVMKRSSKNERNKFLVDKECHPQTIAVIQTRAQWMGIEVTVADASALKADELFGAYLQYPNTRGELIDWTDVIAKLHAAGALVCLGTDLLALMLIKSPGSMGADIAVGSAQRFGVPLGYGGPHAAFMAVKDEFKRIMPGRIIGVSVDASGRPAYRMSLQTREQHIRRDKATSNICTAQALLANMAGFYATYHGPEGLKRIAMRTHFLANLLVTAVASKFKPTSANFFDTVTFSVGSEAAAIQSRFAAKRINVRIENGLLGISLDETTTIADISDLASAITGASVDAGTLASKQVVATSFASGLNRQDKVLQHPVFNRYHTESEMMRYLKRLENKDLSLVHSMISLGSCTMKLNAASEMAPVSSARCIRSLH
jgi:glycine dehydrogenase